MQQQYPASQTSDTPSPLLVVGLVVIASVVVGVAAFYYFWYHRMDASGLTEAQKQQLARDGYLVIGEDRPEVAQNRAKGMGGVMHLATPEEVQASKNAKCVDVKDGKEVPCKT